MRLLLHFGCGSHQRRSNGAVRFDPSRPLRSPQLRLLLIPHVRSGLTSRSAGGRSPLSPLLSAGLVPRVPCASLRVLLPPRKYLALLGIISGWRPLFNYQYNCTSSPVSPNNIDTGNLSKVGRADRNIPYP